jgi:GT2 family glycosyltransferase
MSTAATDGALVSVVILALNKREYTERCLDGLLRSIHRPFEVIVVDNGSTDGTPGMLQQYAAEGERRGAPFKLIFNDTNRGASTARNQGIDAASGDYVAFLDNDVVVRTLTWMERMIDAFREDPRVGIICPKLVYPFPPMLIQCAGAEVSPTGRVNFIGRGEPRDLPQHNRSRPVQCAISAAWMVRRQVIREAGYFDEIYNPVQYEDIDYCYRARHLGHKVLYLASVEMYHFENVTTGKSPRINSPYLIVKNGMKFKERWRFMYSKEGGTLESEMVWRDVDKCPLEEVPPLEFTD